MLRVREITDLVSSQIFIEYYDHTYAGAYWQLQFVGPSLTSADAGADTGQ